MLEDKPSADAEANRLRAVMLQKKVINALNFKGTDSELARLVRLNKPLVDGEEEVDEEGVEGETGDEEDEADG